MYRGSLMTAVLLSAASAAGANSSIYSDLDERRDCTVVAKAQDGDGDWSTLVCQGALGYPVVVAYADARESLFYGFPPEGELPWESFAAFNSAGPRIEWRLGGGEMARPIATIHRWSVDAGGGAAKVEILVIEKVGQPSERKGCAVGYVMATGNPKANEAARRIADRKAETFVCDKDTPEVDAAGRQMPGFNRN